jgi:hypothetical protein
MEYCGFPKQRQWERKGLFADDGYFGGGDFEADEFVGGVEVHMDFEVGGGGVQARTGLSASCGCACGFDGDCAWS